MRQSMPNIENGVRQILHTKMHIVPERITSQALLKEDLGLDSLDIVELIIELEQNFAITITDREADRLHTVNDLISFIEEKIT